MIEPGGTRARRFGAAGAFCIAAIALITSPVRAQTGCSGATCIVEITMPVSDVIRITASPSIVDLGSPTLGDFTTGYRDVIGPASTIVVKANRAFQVQISGTSATFGYTGSLANPLKPATDLQWATSQAGLSSAPNDFSSVMTLMSGTATASASTSLYFRTAWVITRDVPGTYSFAVSLTLSAP